MSKGEKESILSKFFAVNSKPTKETFPELPKILVWFRFTLAVLYGAYLGLGNSPRTSGADLIFGFNFIVFVPSVYCTTFLGAEQASYDNKILFSGVLSSTALLLLIWTYCYTVKHEAEVGALASILAYSISGGVGGGDPILESVGGAGEATLGDVPPMTQDSEF